MTLARVTLICHYDALSLSIPILLGLVIPSAARNLRNAPAALLLSSPVVPVPTCRDHFVRLSRCAAMRDVVILFGNSLLVA